MVCCVASYLSLWAGLSCVHLWTSPLLLHQLVLDPSDLFVVVTRLGSVVTCMSDRGLSGEAIRDLTLAVRNLSIAASTLSSHISGSSSSSAVGPDPEWEVVEESCTPHVTVAEGLARDSLSRCVEDGPLPVPPACLDLARRRLTSVSIGAEARATRAFRAGFWSDAAIQTHTPYQRLEDLKDLKISHWVVLRSNRSPPAFRVTSRRAFLALTEGETDLVFEKFASLVEVQIYCLGASAPVPALLQCKKQM